MDRFVIEGNRELSGVVQISGAKNAALPALAATLLTRGESVIDNVPAIADIRTMVDLLRRLGCQVDLDEREHRVVVDASGVCDVTIPADLAKRMRASFLVTGPLLARCGRVQAPHPGGCALGRRPVNVDIKGFAAMGARVKQEDGFYTLESPSRLNGRRLYLDYPSHTGTENLILAACLAEGRTIIKNASAEPEVVDLVVLLRRMGARIQGEGSAIVQIEGVESLHGVHHRVVPDRIEAGTFAIAAALAGREVELHDIIVAHMDPLTHKLQEVGVDVVEGERTYSVRGQRSLRAVELQTLHYPGFPTDLQAAFAALLTQANGTSLIHERVYDDRLLYAAELCRLGAAITVQGQTATIRGPVSLHGCVVRALDIRCGAALTLAGLAADGTTEILDVHHIDRGYENIDAKLQALGARIQRVDNDS